MSMMCDIWEGNVGFVRENIGKRKEGGTLLTIDSVVDDTIVE